VIPPLTSTPSCSGLPFSKDVSKAPTHAARMHANSAWANFCPMQLRGPCKKAGEYMSAWEAHFLLMRYDLYRQTHS
jgi:hypothetical protein